MRLAKLNIMLLSVVLAVSFCSIAFAKKSKKGKDLVISEVTAEFGDFNNVTLTITGSNFLNKYGEPPFISLGHDRDYTLYECTDDQIVLFADLPDGDYLLLLSHNYRVSLIIQNNSCIMTLS